MVSLPTFKEVCTKHRRVNGNAVEAAKRCSDLRIEMRLQLADSNFSMVILNAISNECCNCSSVFVASERWSYEDHSIVANGVSDLMVAIFGDAGRHTRVATGVKRSSTWIHSRSRSAVFQVQNNECYLLSDHTSIFLS